MQADTFKESRPFHQMKNWIQSGLATSVQVLPNDRVEDRGESVRNLTLDVSNGNEDGLGLLENQALLSAASQDHVTHCADHTDPLLVVEQSLGTGLREVPPKPRPNLHFRR
jgi:hypothetical protein